MKPIHFPEANTVRLAPKGMPEGACADVHVFSDGIVCVTCWQPTPEERAAIAAGGPVWLSQQMGGTMPPSCVFGLTPFIEPPSEQRLQEIADGAPACLNCVHFTGEANSGGACARWRKTTWPHFHCTEHEPQ